MLHATKGHGAEMQRCLWIATASSACEEGFVVDAFDFYAIADVNARDVKAGRCSPCADVSSFNARYG
jgi:hypothetical protein